MANDPSIVDYSINLFSEPPSESQKEMMRKIIEDLKALPQPNIVLPKAPEMGANEATIRAQDISFSRYIKKDRSYLLDDAVEPLRYRRELRSMHPREPRPGRTIPDAQKWMESNLRISRQVGFYLTYEQEDALDRLAAASEPYVRFVGQRLTGYTTLFAAYAMYFSYKVDDSSTLIMVKTAQQARDMADLLAELAGQRRPDGPIQTSYTVKFGNKSTIEVWIGDNVAINMGGFASRMNVNLVIADEPIEQEFIGNMRCDVDLAISYTTEPLRRKSVLDYDARGNMIIDPKFYAPVL